MLTILFNNEDIVLTLQKYKEKLQRDFVKKNRMNLREENEGVNIILKQANKSIRKDKFSAFEYGLYYIKQEEDSKKRRKHGRISDYIFMN